MSEHATLALRVQELADLWEQGGAPAYEGQQVRMLVEDAVTQLRNMLLVHEAVWGRAQDMEPCKRCFGTGVEVAANAGTCVHCGRPAQGYASVNKDRLCHGADRDCYRLVTVYGHAMPCTCDAEWESRMILPPQRKPRLELLFREPSTFDAGAHEHAWQTLRDSTTGTVISHVCATCGEQREG